LGSTDVSACALGLSRVSNVCAHYAHVHDVGSVLAGSVSSHGPVSRYCRLIFVFCTAPQGQVAMSVISLCASGVHWSGDTHPLKSTVTQLLTLCVWWAVFLPMKSPSFESLKVSSLASLITTGSSLSHLAYVAPGNGPACTASSHRVSFGYPQDKPCAIL
jgi:hypothetical protein